MRIEYRPILLAAILALMPIASQAAKVEESPGALVMAGDFLVARPIGLIIFSLGTVTFAATLPFSLLGGNMGDSAKVLVLNPAREVFVRCLGCRSPGRKEKIATQK